MSQEKRDINLQRRQAMRRKGFVWEQTGTLAKLEESARRWRESSSRHKPRGSSLDLTPTLLGIYDQIASAHQESQEGPADQSDSAVSAGLTNQNLQDETMDQTDSTKLLSSVLKDKTNFEQNGNLLDSSDNVKPVIKVDSENVLDVKLNLDKVKMEGNENNITDIDSKKRPLSLSSMSSSSTSSLPRQRKRPNLCEYSDSSSSGQLDIEKLDNLLYIDDSAEVETPNPTDDELSIYSMDREEKTKSAEDSDSQISMDQSVTGDQRNFNQSDSGITLTSSDSAKSSASDIHKIVQNSGKLYRETPVRTPSRTSTGSRSSGSSMKQTGHYVSHVQRVVSEIVETERCYVAHLHDIKVGYYEYILSTPSVSISGPDLGLLFGNIVDIYNFSCHFLEQLESCGMDPIQVADCFVRNNQGFVIYADYCTNYPSAVAVLTKVMHDTHLSEVFKQRQVAMGHSLPLGAYLLKPVQRVLKYHLLLQNILKHYSKTDPGYSKLAAAFDHMTDMSHQINEMKRKHEHAVRVQEIQSQLEDYEGEDFTRLGELVLEGSFRIHGIKASRQMFLFERGVIIAKRKEDGMLSCKVYIPCATLMLVESIPGEPLNFQILPFDNPKLTHTIHARNLDQKRKWCREIKRLMLESYSSKIPENVKDLIMQKLGKSKEEEDFASVGGTETSKSHVSTPDYLEKRQKVRRKSGNLIPGIPEILKQKARRSQGRARSETPSPRPSPSMGNGLPYDKLSSHNTDVEHYGFRSNIPGLSAVSPLSRKHVRNQESPAPKRPVSIQRSHSFQHATSRDPFKSQELAKDSASMEDLTHSDGPPIRTKSFRLATRLSPIKLEASDETDSTIDSSKLDKVLTHKHDNENIPPEVRKTIDEEMKKLHKTPYKFNTLTFKMDHDSGVDSNLRKRGRYSSMPALNHETPNSPKLSRLHSERSAYSPTINRTSVTPTKQLDLKNYFNYNKDWLQNTLSQKDSNKENESNSLSRETKPVLAFHDVFSNLRKSSENLSSKSLPQKPLSLTQPKPFTSTLKVSANKMGSHAKLDKWKNDEKFTKGSMSDLSHLSEDPWIPSKTRSSTESKISHPKDSVSKLSELNGTHTKDSSYIGKPVNTQKCRLSLDEDLRRHIRTQSFTGDDRSFSRDNLDWLVYANRNSLPVSGISNEELLLSKYCTPPRGSMIPPSSHGTSPVNRPSRHDNVVSSYATTPRGDATDRLNGYGNSGSHYETATDSSVSLSATNTSSETCSSPDILKDSVFDEAFSPDKFFGPDKTRLSRSFSSPENKRSSKFRKDLSEDRPSSMDILGEVRHIEASEKLVAEMEHYMKHSSSSSSSLNSNNNKFPKSIPTFTESERENYKRDSVVSTGSNSSYESAREELESEHDETIVESIKTKFHNITAKFGGKKLNIDQQHKTNGELSNPNSPVKLKRDEHPAKVSPLSHNLSLRVKPGHQKSPEPDLPSLLLESKPGSEAIGSRMANPDFDDYATFSLPRAQPEVEESNVNIKRRSETYFRPTKHLSGSKSVSHSGLASKYSPVTSLKNLHIQQSDSAFSIQSADIDSSTPSDSPRNDNEKDAVRPTETETADNFYEKRLSIALNSDEAFRDSAVYCDDLDTPVASPREPVIPSKVHIKDYVQQLEEKNKRLPPSPVKVKQREPGSIIKQRMESLQANLDSQKSSSTSRSISTANSRTQSQSTSRDTSRAPSEEKQLTSKSLRELIDTKFPMERTLSFPVDHSERFKDDDEVFRNRSSSSSSAKLKSAFSMGRLDQLSTDVDNLTIMKGWVRQLIEKFQSEK